MKLKDIKPKLNEDIYKVLKAEGIDELRPAQEKSINADLLEGKSILVCTPTASGKTLVAEMAMTEAITSGKGKAIYLAPLKALASEKFKDFKRKYDSLFKIAMSIGDMDSTDPYLVEYDMILMTSEKMDSLIRHHAPWLKYVSVVVVDEIHLLNDPGRGPTLEILLTILKTVLPKAQIIGLSATIGNPKELANWLGAELVLDNWRPVKLKQGVYLNGEIEFV